MIRRATTFALALLIAVSLVHEASAQEVPDRGDVRIVVISDLNGSYGSTDYSSVVDSTIARIPRLWAPDLVLAGGDMVAGQSTSLTDENVQAMWDAFDDHIGRPLREANLPFGFTIGNHDGSALSGYQRDRDFASAYWNDEEHTPALNFADRANFPFWYTFTHDDLFFLVWDASSATVQDMSWVESALQSEAAQNASMRFVIGHLPIYGVAEGRNSAGEILSNPETLRALLEGYDVHTYISGHHHAYYPGRRGELELLHAGSVVSYRPLIGSTTPSPMTVSVLDIDKASGDVRNTTFDVQTMEVIDITTLPRSITSVNGFVLRQDITGAGSYGTNLSPVHLSSTVVSGGSGTIEAEVVNDRLDISGELQNLEGDPAVAALYEGVHGRGGEHVMDLTIEATSSDIWSISGDLALDVDARDRLLAGGYFILVTSDAYPEGELRGQLLFSGNSAPEAPAVTSPADGEEVIVEDRLGQRLYKASWPAATDPDGDVLQYRYELSPEEDFSDIWLASSTGLFREYSGSRSDLYAMLAENGVEEGATVTLYQRVVVSDGSEISTGVSSTVQMSRGIPVSSEKPGTRDEFGIRGAYPNPASDMVELKVSAGAGGAIDVSLYNMLGQRVARTESDFAAAGSLASIQLDVRGLAPGVYVIRTTQPGSGSSHSTTLTIAR